MSAIPRTREKVMRRSTMVLFAVLALLLTGSLVLGQNAARQAKSGHAHHDATTKALAHCLTECSLCMGHCAKLVEEGKKDHLTTMKPCDECAAVCFVTLKMTGTRTA